MYLEHQEIPHFYVADFGYGIKDRNRHFTPLVKFTGRVAEQRVTIDQLFVFEQEVAVSQVEFA